MINIKRQDKTKVPTALASDNGFNALITVPSRYYSFISITYLY